MLLFVVDLMVWILVVGLGLFALVVCGCTLFWVVVVFVGCGGCCWFALLGVWVGWFLVVTVVLRS